MSLPVKKLSLLSAASDGVSPASTRILWTPPFGYGLMRAVSSDDTTRLLVTSNWGLYDGANTWTLTGPASSASPGIYEYSSSQRRWFVQPAAALPVGNRLRVNIVFTPQ